MRHMPIPSIELTRSKVLLLAMVGLLSVAPLSGCISKKNLSQGQPLIERPELDPALVKDDFAFPSRPPRLSAGKVVFDQNCATCHSVKPRYERIKNVRPIDMYLTISRGDKNHNPDTFKTLTRDQRWEAVFYYRYLAGGADIKTKDVAALFGSNCAVCHGSKGFADGPLHSGHASAHELGMAPVKGAFDPPPADFHSYSRMYNRTDDQLVKHIAEGIYPSAMPSFMGRRDVDKDIVFTEDVIRDLVKYVRAFSYEHDLTESSESGGSSQSVSKQLSALTKDVSGKLERRQ